jgi:hypothetical protein
MPIQPVATRRANLSSYAADWRARERARRQDEAEWRARIARWIHPEKARYSEAELCRDLLGDWTLVRGWRRLGRGGGSAGMYKCLVAVRRR